MNENNGDRHGAAARMLRMLLAIAAFAASFAIVYNLHLGRYLLELINRH